MSTNVIPLRPIAAPAVSPHWADQSAANCLRCVYYLAEARQGMGDQHHGHPKGGAV